MNIGPADGNLAAIDRHLREMDDHAAREEAALDDAYERASWHKIVVNFECPPIPNADHYCAYSDDIGGDESPYGHGPDAASAIDDLMEQLAEWEMEQ